MNSHTRVAVTNRSPNIALQAQRLPLPLRLFIRRPHGFLAMHHDSSHESRKVADAECGTWNPGESGRLDVGLGNLGSGLYLAAAGPGAPLRSCGD